LRFVQSLNSGKIVRLLDFAIVGLRSNLPRATAKEMQHDGTFAMAVAVLALLAVPAQAQMGGGKGGHKSDDTKAEDKKPKVNDKAYQEALKRIPDPKEKYDPWSVAKTPDADKKSSK
jgi:hypothetical protein